MIENQSRWCEVEGGQVHYLVEGAEDGQPVVLLSRASFCSETWKQIGTIGVLSQAGYLVYAVDRPGCGKSPYFDSPPARQRVWISDRCSPVPPEFGPPPWICVLLDTLKIERAVVVSPFTGWSHSQPLEPEKTLMIEGTEVASPFTDWSHSRPLEPEKVDRVSGLVEVVSAGIRSYKDSLFRQVLIPKASQAPNTSDPAAFHNELLRFLEELR